MYINVCRSSSAVIPFSFLSQTSSQHSQSHKGKFPAAEITVYCRNIQGLSFTGTKNIFDCGIAAQSALPDLGWSGPCLREPVSNLPGSASGLRGFIWALTSLHLLWSTCVGPGPGLVSVLRLQAESPWGFILAECCSLCFSWSIL